MSCRIAITAYSCLSPLGDNMDHILESLNSGRDISKEIDASIYAEEVEGLNTGPYELHRVEALCAATLKRAFSSSELDLGNMDSSRIGIILGNTYGAERFKGEFFEVIRESEPALTSPSLFPYTAANTLAAKLAILFGATGRCLTFSSGITSSSEAVVNACDILQDKKVDAVAVVGESFYYDMFSDVFDAAGFRNEYVCCIILRREDDAVKGGEPLLAVIDRVEHGFDPEHDPSRGDASSSRVVLNWGKGLGDIAKTCSCDEPSDDDIIRMDSIFGNTLSASGVLGMIFSLHIGAGTTLYVNRDSYGSFVSTLISDGRNGTNN